MALRTNSKAFKKNLINYIREESADYIAADYSEEYTANFDLADDNDLCRCIYNIYKAEKFYNENYIRHNQITDYQNFKDWAQGLALGGLFTYYYNVSAIKLLGDMLEQTETERNKYEESEAEETLTRLIYREITNRL